jgi:hypothetical protein
MMRAVDWRTDRMSGDYPRIVLDLDGRIAGFAYATQHLSAP